jgi:hypothetical protein
MSITYTIYNSDGVFHGVVQESGSVKSNIPEDGFAVDGEQNPLSTCIGGTLVVPSDSSIEAENYAKNIEIFRIDRNILLAATDWTQAADSPLSETDKQNYRTYRQNLRDMPAQDGFDPLNPVWPTLP